MVGAWLEAEREQWFLWVPVLFGAGIALYFALAGEPPLWLAFLPAAGALGFRAIARGGGLVSILAGALVLVALGFAVAKLRTEWVRAPVLERRSGAVEVTGFVELIEPRPTRGERISLRVTAIEGLATDRLPRRIRVRTLSAAASFVPGDAIRFKAVLTPPQAPPLPEGYDFARAAWFQSLGGVGYAITRPARVDAGVAPWTLRARAAIEQSRKHIGTRVRAALPGESGAIANALITGERGGISEPTNGAYKSSGLYHVLSISGLHMVIVAGSVLYSVRFLLATVPAVALRYPIKKWAAAAALIAALLYLMISGSAFATVRSAIMISILFLAILLDRPAIALRNVALAALAILVVWPESLLDTGFQMSFAAVGALVAAFEAIKARDRRRDRGRRNPFVRVLLFFGGIVLSTLVASAAVAPFAAFHFHQTQQFALLSNLVAVPICNLVVMPSALLTLLAMPFGAEYVPLWVMGQGIDAMTACAAFVGALPGAVGRVPAVPASAFALVIAGAMWVVLWRRRARLAGFPLILAGVTLIGAGPQRPDILISQDGKLVPASRGPAVRAPGARFDV